MSTQTCMIEVLESRQFLSAEGASVMPAPAMPQAAPMIADAAPNKPKRARDLGAVVKPLHISGWVGKANAHDYFRLRLERRGNLTIGLSGLSQTASVQLLNAKGKLPAIAADRGNATAAARVSRELPAGTYFLHVEPVKRKGKGRVTTTPYQLSVSMDATPIGGTANFGGRWSGTVKATVTATSGGQTATQNVEVSDDAFIRQDGNRVTWQSNAPVPGLSTTQEGIVNGRKFTFSGQTGLGLIDPSIRVIEDHMSGSATLNGDVLTMNATVKIKAIVQGQMVEIHVVVSGKLRRVS